MMKVHQLKGQHWSSKDQGEKKRKSDAKNYGGLPIRIVTWGGTPKNGCNGSGERISIPFSGIEEEIF